MPTLPITALSGIVFGPMLGTVLSLIGANIGAILSFLLARYLARGYIKRISFGKYNYLRKIFEPGGTIFLAFIRVIPILPFALINYSYGLTPMSFTRYTVVSFLFMVPSTVAYVFLGISFHENIINWIIK